MREMEEEAAKLKQIQNEVSISMTSPSAGSGAGSVNMSYEEKVEVDARSVYVGNVDYGATAEELEQHFHGCGSINRVTILCNKFDGQPKGFAYVEFTDKDSVDTAMALDDSLFRGRQIKVRKTYLFGNILTASTATYTALKSVNLLQGSFLKLYLISPSLDS